MMTQESGSETRSPHRRQAPTPAGPLHDACTGWSVEQAEQAFLEHLTMIQRLIAAVARQHRLSPDDGREFSSSVLLRLISDDYAVLRKYRGRCLLRTFLTVVVQRLCLDFRAAQWGKWRPAMDTRRAGDVAILLERLTMRDGLTFDEAVRTLQINHRVTLDGDTLLRIYGGFRRRARPRRVSEEEISELPTWQHSPDSNLVSALHDRVMTSASEALGRALADIDPTDRLILQLRFANQMVVADIGRMLSLDYKWIFRRINRLMGILRQRLEAEGLRADEVLPALGQATSDHQVEGLERADPAGASTLRLRPVRPASAAGADRARPRWRQPIDTPRR